MHLSGTVLALAATWAVLMLAFLSLRRRTVGASHQTRFVGRQQIRSAARQEAYRQVGGAAVDRRTRRQAARDLGAVVSRRRT